MSAPFDNPDWDVSQPSYEPVVFESEETLELNVDPPMDMFVYDYMLLHH